MGRGAEGEIDAPHTATAAAWAPSSGLGALNTPCRPAPARARPLAASRLPALWCAEPLDMRAPRILGELVRTMSLRQVRQTARDGCCCNAGCNRSRCGGNSHQCREARPCVTQKGRRQPQSRRASDPQTRAASASAESAQPRCAKAGPLATEPGPRNAAKLLRTAESRNASLLTRAGDNATADMRVGHPARSRTLRGRVSE